MKRYKYDNTTKEWQDYKAHLHQLQHLGYPRMFLEAVVAYEKPKQLLLQSNKPLLALGEDELKQAATVVHSTLPPEAERQAATAADDGYKVTDGGFSVVGAYPDLDEYPETILKTKPVSVDSTKDRINPSSSDFVNAIHNNDAPQTQEEIDAAWQRHKDFLGMR